MKNSLSRNTKNRNTRKHTECQNMLKNEFTFASGSLLWMVDPPDETHRLMGTKHLLFHCHGSRMLLLLPQVKGEV